MVEQDLRRLEELGLNASAPPAQLMYDGWLLRLLPGKAKRARSINAVYPSALRLSEKLAYCEKLYRSHDLPAIFRLTPFSEPPSLDDALEHLGYEKFETTAVETARIDFAGLSPGDAEPWPLDAWVQVVGDMRASPPEHRASHLRRLRHSPLELQAMVLRRDNEFVGAGLVIVEDDWAGLFDIVTHPQALRRGYGRQIVSGLLYAAWNRGARQAYLQVGADNTAARLLYRQTGFRERYCYWYRALPSESTS